MAVVPVSPTRERLPKWMKRRLNTKTMSARTNDILRREGLVTVCEEATCHLSAIQKMLPPLC